MKSLLKVSPKPKKILTTDPLGYFDMVMLEKNATVIATDSGLMQKEAFFHGVPCVTLRHKTEWLELLLDLVWDRLSPPLGCNISPTILDIMGTTGQPGNPYGNGNAAQKIANNLTGAL